MGVQSPAPAQPPTRTAPSYSPPLLHSVTVTMSAGRTKNSCFVVGCKDPHSSLHHLPTNKEIRDKWIHFIYDGQVPATVSSSPFVCAKHFTTDCFSNLGQFKNGFAKRLSLQVGAIPTLRATANVKEEPDVSITWAECNPIAITSIQILYFTLYSESEQYITEATSLCTCLPAYNT